MNKTPATFIILLEFSNNNRTNTILFLIFFIIYALSFILNALIICIIVLSRNLHIPMYFFLCNLSFLDLCFTTNAVPSLLAHILSADRSIPLSSCLLQMHISLFLGSTECLLLAIMAYDRYVAICHPLYYTVLMSWNMCYQASAITWLGSFIMSIVPSLITHVTLCYPNLINHFMCEILAVLNLVCDNKRLSQLLIFSLTLVLILLPFLFIITSYICIIYSVLKVDSVRRLKAFSTCTSHLTVVGLFYVTAMVIYFGTPFNYLINMQKYISVIYVVITPMLNPLIYSLKNKEIKEAFRKLLTKLSC